MNPTRQTPARSRGRPSADDVLDLEAHLSEVALHEFVEHGYGGASLSRIVRDARISKTTLYARFASKEALFRHILLQEIEGTANDVSAVLQDVQDLETGLRAFACSFLEASLHGRLLHVIRLIYSEAYRFPELRQVTDDNLEPTIAHVSAFLARCARLQGTSLKQPDEVARAFVLMIRGWYMDKVLFGRPVTAPILQEWVDSAVRVTLRAAPEWQG